MRASKVRECSQRRAPRPAPRRKKIHHRGTEAQRRETRTSHGVGFFRDYALDKEQPTSCPARSRLECCEVPLKRVPLMKPQQPHALATVFLERSVSLRTRWLLASAQAQSRPVLFRPPARTRAQQRPSPEQRPPSPSYPYYVVFRVLRCRAR